MPQQASVSIRPNHSCALQCFMVQFTGYLLSIGSDTNCLCIALITSPSATIFILDVLHLCSPFRHLRSPADIGVVTILSLELSPVVTILSLELSPVVTILSLELSPVVTILSLELSPVVSVRYYPWNYVGWSCSALLFSLHLPGTNSLFLLVMLPPSTLLNLT